MSLSANITAGSYAVTQFTQQFAGALRMGLAAAEPLAMARMYQQMNAQANMLAYKNAFAVLAGVLLVLSPLVWIMRLPPKRVAVDPEQMAAH